MKKILIIRHVDIEGPGTLGAYLQERKSGYLLADVWQDNAACLYHVDLAGIAGVVVLGGPMNVYEEEKYPFLTVEKYLIRELVSQKIPLLGICLGAQLIAASLGGRVKKSPVKEIGWFFVEVTDAAQNDPLMKGFKTGTKVFQWHEDTFELPAGAVLLAEGSGIPQAFSFRNLAWGFQFHVEVDSSMISSWQEAYGREGQGAQDGKGLLAAYADLKDVFNGQGRRIFESFLRQAFTRTA